MPFAMALKILGLGKLQRASKKAPAQVESNTVIAMRKAVELVRGRAQFNIRGSRAGNPPDRLGRVSGRLAGSIGGKVKGSGKSIQGFISTNVIYAKIHEFGGIIKAVRAPFLVFKIGDRLIRTKSVRIPPRPYMGPALEWARPEIRRLFGRGLQLGIEGRRAG